MSRHVLKEPAELKDASVPRPAEVPNPFCQMTEFFHVATRSQVVAA
jgi:hypothetical protein